MKAKVLAALAATMAVSATYAFAANPFVDVPTDSWAYKSVVELADAGVIQGVDGEYFQGQRNITRYEAAEMVAKAMAHMDKATVEQRALINKLADEYADELNNLGVRVSNLENKVGNIKFTGDARLRYRYINGERDNDNSWDYRIRLRGQAQVNDRVTATVGLSTDNQNFGSNGSTSAGTNEDGDVFADVIKVDYNFGSPNWNLSLGRDADWIIGGPRSYGFQYADVADRAELQFNNGKLAVTAGYAKLKEGTDVAVGGKVNAWDPDDMIDGVKTAYGEIEGFFGNGSSVGVYYYNFNGGDKFYDKESQGADDYLQFWGDDLWGGYVNWNFGSKWNVLANYENVNFADDQVNVNGDDSANVWIGRVTYGKASMAQPKSWDIWVEYIDAEDGAFLGGSTNSWRFGDYMDNITSWGAGIDYVFAKNAKFSVMQSFATDTKDGHDDNNAREKEQTRAEFVFAF
ncbi:S-layer homology domain-containing protein [Megasphaera butyrica]|uniref:S-layer homology domain-containing protein n=1 Tax=Megasphaera butyrica TaxID=2981791 RepID=UPI000822AAFB|nr:S-layer homology domain-containing protein [Megasphaera butyrica]MCU6714343.1 S-layer homology domain-containing protein [Megasphaera butyrica]SCH50526.1 Endo-beta-mannanase [uncultured Megasphaera sp.]SCJ70511.1 Endo-beta-mannanase [uncultured Ruminococcus sp.]